MLILVHEIVFERQKIREKMEVLGQSQSQKIGEIEKLHSTKIALLAAKGFGLKMP